MGKYPRKDYKLEENIFTPPEGGVVTFSQLYCQCSLLVGPNQRPESLRDEVHSDQPPEHRRWTKEVRGANEGSPNYTLLGTLNNDFHLLLNGHVQKL